LIGFGLLAFSRTPVLQDIGLTVGIGAFLALVFSAILSRHADDGTVHAYTATR
jgi:predicted exporter